MPEPQEPAAGEPPSRDVERTDFPQLLEIPTRWHDNDVYGHVNNVDYYAFFDTVINEWLIREGGLDIHGGNEIGVCAESRCRFFESFSFPETVEACLRVSRLGERSVRYELALFSRGAARPAATGWFVHVFVDRGSRNPVAIPAALRDALARLTPGGDS